MLFKKLGTFEKYIRVKTPYSIDLSAFSEGMHQDKNIFFKLGKGQKIEWIIDRTCDHAGGILLKSNNDDTKAICPLHNWELDLNSLCYSKIPNQVFSKICKAPLPFTQQGNILKYDLDEYAIRIPENWQLTSDNYTKAKLRHIAHASVNITLDDINIATDPWLVGECFSTGWWHNNPPKSDAFDLCNKADFIYISHNHPDHMHAESLSKISKDQHFIIPEFATDSVLKPMKQMGFNNLHVLEKGVLYRYNDTDLIISILPCGDQRDDSALYLSKGDFSALLTVDCNAVNHYLLPENLTLLMTNFAAGASGWPIVYETMSMEERKKVITKNRNSQMFEILKYCEVTKPKVYIPYAGYFSEAAERDKFIKDNNNKNSPELVIEKVTAKFPEITGINPIEFDEVEFEFNTTLFDKYPERKTPSFDWVTIVTDESCRRMTASGNVAVNCKKIDLPKLYEVDKDYINKYLSNFKKQAEGFDINKVVSYFKNSGFQDDLVMYLILTDDDFNNVGDGVKISFFEKNFSYEIKSGAALEKEFNDLESDPENKTFMLKTRKDSLWNIISKQLPFEELSIGFQCRIYRKPDVYHARFWKFFTSEFIFGESCRT